jgi:2-polyprenyl-3-methyl-5-hydroxy-6-metoxy-1,4-benzoquinol methylase
MLRGPQVRQHEARYRWPVDAGWATGRALDAGCGAGYGSAMLADTGAWTLGVDRSPTAIAHAKKHYGPGRPNLMFQVSDLRTWQPQAGVYNLITWFECIEHLREDDAHTAFARLLAGLATGGRLLISTPAPACWGSPYHVREYRLEEFQGFFARYPVQVTRWAQRQTERIERWHGQDDTEFYLAEITLT